MSQCLSCIHVSPLHKDKRWSDHAVVSCQHVRLDDRYLPSRIGFELLCLVDGKLWILQVLIALANQVSLDILNFGYGHLYSHTVGNDRFEVDQVALRAEIDADCSACARVQCCKLLLNVLIRDVRRHFCSHWIVLNLVR